MIYVTSDLHGYPLDSFMRLLDKARFSDADDLIVLGDVIDRNGDGGIETLLWMTGQVNVRMILGNHEAMLLRCRFLFEAITGESLSRLDQDRARYTAVWMRNGAEATLKGWKRLYTKDPESAEGILEYLEEAPLYEAVRVSGREYWLTHAGLGNFAPDKGLEDYAPDELLWTRPPLTERYHESIVTIFGHTPTRYYGPQYEDRMLRTPTWIDIDTGAAGGRHPMLLRLGDEEPFYQDA